ncbi:MAG: hypothetical protein ACI4FX_03035 [Agathobacter sp.]
MAKTSNGSASIFAGMKKVNTEEKPKKKEIDNPSVRTDNDGTVKKSEKPTGEGLGEVFTNSSPTENLTITKESEENDKQSAVTSVLTESVETPEVPRIVHAQASDVRATTISIQQSSANFLAYKTKMIGENRDTCLAMIISKDLESGENAVPDFFAPVEKKQRIDSVNKSVRLPADILEKAKRKAAIEMKTLSGYIDDLLQNEIKKM